VIRPLNFRNFNTDLVLDPDKAGFELEPSRIDDIKCLPQKGVRCPQMEMCVAFGQIGDRLGANLVNRK
jgi:hypothetical protein